MRRFVYICCCLWLSFFPAKGQISQGGKPYSFNSTLRNYNSDTIHLKENLISFEMPKIKESVFDSIRQNNVLNNEYQFAYDFHTSINVKEQSTIDSIDIGIIYRLVVKSEGAKSLNLIFDEFSVPRGAKLFIYSKDKINIIGAFTSNNNNDSGKLPTVPVYGDEIVVEYFEPYFSEFAGILKISRVNHDFVGMGVDQAEKNSEGGSGDCHVDVNCSPEGDAWKAEKRSVCKIIIQGTRNCTGVLLNNTSMDGTPYILTACHCIPSQNIANQSLFIFNYERPGCNSGTATNTQSISSGILRASNAQTDFALVELSHKPLSSWNPYYAGWDIQSEQNAGGVCIHHPEGDVKKISTHNTTLQASPCFDDNNYYWIDQWLPTTNGFGIIENGSSGAPLYNSNHKVIGQVSGSCFLNVGFCDNPTLNDSNFGNLSMSWNSGNSIGNRLKDWLDPTSTNVRQLEGAEVCPTEVFENLSLSHTVNNGVVEIKQATQSIASSSVISENAHVWYKAGQDISLVHGFHALSGSQFYATTGQESVCVPGCYPMTLTLVSNLFSNGGYISILQTNASHYFLRLVNYSGQLVYQYSGIVNGYQCDIPIQTNYLAAGQYLATITLFNECDELSSSFRLINIGARKTGASVSVDSIETNFSFSNLGRITPFDFDVFPNPTSGDFYISIKTDMPFPYSMELINNQGRTLFHVENVRENMIHLEKTNLPAGLYFINITKNDVLLSKKLIIK